jgi:hypothetical protein
VAVVKFMSALYRRHRRYGVSVAPSDDLRLDAFEQQLQPRPVHFTRRGAAPVGQESSLLETVVRNNSRRGHFGVRRLQTQADSGMMSACCSWREQSSEFSRTS